MASGASFGANSDLSDFNIDIIVDYDQVTRLHFIKFNISDTLLPLKFI